MKKFNRATTIISGIGEGVYWVGTVLVFVMTIISVFGKLDWLSKLSDVIPGATIDLTSTGFSLESVDGSPMTKGAYIIFFITMLFVFSALAMIFRNVKLILKTTNGKTWFSKGNTPFQPDNIRMVREIGIFFIIIPVIEFIMSIISHFVLPQNIECSVEFTFIIVGFIVICLSQYFAYGMQLQNDVDGLL